MGCLDWVETYVADIDDIFCYITYKSVRIRDRRLGAISYFLMLIIIVYVFIYQLYFQRSYRVQSPFSGSANIQVLSPTQQYRWPDGGPYCSGVPSILFPPRMAMGYNVSDLTYTFYAGPSHGRLPCWRWDGADMGGISSGGFNSFVLPTRVDVFDEVAVDDLTGVVCTHADAGGGSTLLTGLPLVVNGSRSNCSWVALSNSSQFVADAEWFGLVIEHSVTTTTGITTRSTAMSGAGLLDAGGGAVDLCGAYAAGGLVCPAIVNVGMLGKQDTLPLAALLRAGLIGSLDAQSVYTDTLSKTQIASYRSSGVELLLNIYYENTSGDIGQIFYQYRVSSAVSSAYTLTRTLNVAAGASGTSSPLRRQRQVVAGVHVVVAQAGNYGTFDSLALLVNLTVGLGLLRLASLITDFLAKNVLPLWPIYYQYLETQSVDFSNFREVKCFPAIMQAFREDRHLVDPIPPLLADAVPDNQAAQFSLQLLQAQFGRGAYAPDTHTPGTPTPDLLLGGHTPMPPNATTYGADKGGGMLLSSSPSRTPRHQHLQPSPQHQRLEGCGFFCRCCKRHTRDAPASGTAYACSTATAAPIPRKGSALEAAATVRSCGGDSLQGDVSLVSPLRWQHHQQQHQQPQEQKHHQHQQPQPLQQAQPSQVTVADEGPPPVERAVIPSSDISAHVRAKAGPVLPVTPTPYVLPPLRDTLRHHELYSNTGRPSFRYHPVVITIVRLGLHLRAGKGRLAASAEVAAARLELIAHQQQLRIAAGSSTATSDSGGTSGLLRLQKGVFGPAQALFNSRGKGGGVVRKDAAGRSPTGVHHTHSPAAHTTLRIGSVAAHAHGLASRGVSRPPTHSTAPEAIPDTISTPGTDTAARTTPPVALYSGSTALNPLAFPLHPNVSEDHLAGSDVVTLSPLHEAAATFRRATRAAAAAATADASPSVVPSSMSQPPVGSVEAIPPLQTRSVILANWT